MELVNDSPRRSPHFRVVSGALLCLLVAAGGCRKNSEEADALAAPLQSEVAAPEIGPGPETREISSAPRVNSSPPQTPAAPPLSENVLDLETRYRAASVTPADRDAIVRTLGRSPSPQALPALRRIFDEEKRLELRMLVLEVAADLPSEPPQAGRWELFSRATEARQPLLMRLSAMQTLADSEDPRTVPLLQALTRDPHASIRENAVRILKERQL